MTDAQNGEAPPEQAISPSKQPHKLTCVPDGDRRTRRQEAAPIVCGEATLSNSLAQHLEPEGALSKGSTQHHLLPYFLLLKMCLIEMLKEDQGVKDHCEGEARTDFEIRHNDDRDLETRADMSVVT